MSDFISRQAAIYAVTVGAMSAAMVFGRTEHGMTALKETIRAIKELPSAQPERKNGKWIWMGDKGDSRFMCSVCKAKENVPTCNGEPTIWEFCPNCGAEMQKAR